MNASDVLRAAERAGVQTVRFVYCDHGGVIRAKAIQVAHLRDKLREGVGLTRAQMAMNLGEDACLIHVQHGPTVLALLRDATLNLLRQAGYTHIAATLRDHAQHPAAAVALVLRSAPTHA